MGFKFFCRRVVEPYGFVWGRPNCCLQASCVSLYHRCWRIDHGQPLRAAEIDLDHTWWFYLTYWILSQEVAAAGNLPRSLANSLPGELPRLQVRHSVLPSPQRLPQTSPTLLMPYNPHFLGWSTQYGLWLVYAFRSEGVKNHFDSLTNHIFPTFPIWMQIYQPTWQAATYTCWIQVEISLSESSHRVQVVAAYVSPGD
jgi:hypothetical protein